MNRRFFLVILCGLLIGYYGYTFWVLYNRNNTEQYTIRNIMQTWNLEDDSGRIVHSPTSLQDSEKSAENFCLNNEQEKDMKEGTLIHDAEEHAENSVNNDLPNDFDCILSIPAINLEKIVYTGNTREDHLQQYDLITSAKDMYYCNGGNYIICGHYSQLYGHSLNRLKELNKGDYVYIISNNKKDQYVIYSVEFESMSDTGSYCKQTKQREITILSCAKYIAADKYIIIKGKLKVENEP